MILSDMIGLVGVVCLLTAYFLLQADKINTDGFSFSILNLLGASMLLFSLFFSWNLASVVVEFVWMMISILGIVRVSYKRKKQQYPVK